MWTSSAAGRSTIVSIDHLPDAIDNAIVAQGPLRTDESDRRAHGNNPELRGDPHAKLELGLTGTKDVIGVAGDPHIITDFHQPATGPIGQKD